MTARLRTDVPLSSAAPESPLGLLVEDFLAERFSDDPVSASGVGLEGYDDLLPDLSAEAVARREAREDEWTQAFTALGDAGLSDQERVDRDLVLADLAGHRVMRDWQAWRRSPDAYTVALGGTFLLLLHRLRPEPELARSVAARLAGLPEALAQGRANLEAELCSPVLVRRALGGVRGGISYCRTVAGELAEDLRGPVVEAGERAAVALESYAEFLEDLATRATGDFAIGEQRYDGLLREREGLSFGARELSGRGRAEWERLAGLMAEQATAMGDPDWRATLTRLDQDHPPTPEAMRDEYEAWTERARRFCLDHDLVSLPEGEECLVVPSPPFQRAMLAVASYMPPPSATSSRRGHFFVPYPPDGATRDQVDQRLATNSRSGAASLTVHEAWPGHHWHLAWVAARQPGLLRSVVWSSYTVEGWGLYTEQMMREQGFYQVPSHAFRQTDARLFRAARVFVDTALHLGEMTRRGGGRGDGAGRLALAGDRPGRGGALLRVADAGCFLSHRCVGDRTDAAGVAGRRRVAAGVPRHAGRLGLPAVGSGRAVDARRRGQQVSGRRVGLTPPQDAVPPVRWDRAPAPGTVLDSHYRMCFGCGPDHPTGLRMEVTAGDGVSLTARFVVAEVHQGAPGLAHGGLLAAAFDEALGMLLRILGCTAVTARLETDFQAPVPIGTVLAIAARVDAVAGRKVYCSAEGRVGDDGPVAVRAQALFVRVGLEHFTTHGWGPVNQDDPTVGP